VPGRNNVVVTDGPVVAPAHGSGGEQNLQRLVARSWPAITAWRCTTGVSIADSVNFPVRNEGAHASGLAASGGQS
jgi:hypothetical protein